MCFVNIFCIFSALSASVEDLWIQGVEFYDQGNYIDSEIAFNTAIELFESDGNSCHAYMYIDRAALRSKLDRNTEALNDLNKALESENLVLEDRLRALLNRASVKSFLNMNEESEIDLELYNQLNPYKIIVHVLEDKIVIRNIPQSPCFINIVAAFSVASGICNDVADVQSLDSRICVVKRRTCAECTQKNDAMAGSAEGEKKCTGWCNKCAASGAAMCGVFKSKICIASCAAAVEYLREVCAKCCKNGEFYKNCIEPFSRIADFMETKCDPQWD
jgi:tetratricopeptide (TPR) repeat protein